MIFQNNITMLIKQHDISGKNFDEDTEAIQLILTI